MLSAMAWEESVESAGNLRVWSDGLLSILGLLAQGRGVGCFLSVAFWWWESVVSCASQANLEVALLAKSDTGGPGRPLTANAKQPKLLLLPQCFCG